MTTERYRLTDKLSAGLGKFCAERLTFLSCVDISSSNGEVPTVPSWIVTGTGNAQNGASLTREHVERYQSINTLDEPFPTDN